MAERGVASSTGLVELMRCLVVVVCVVSQGIIQSRLRVNPVTGDNVASWRGVLFRHLKIQGNDRLAEAASKIHKCVVYGVSSVDWSLGLTCLRCSPCAGACTMTPCSQGLERRGYP